MDAPGPRLCALRHTTVVSHRQWSELAPWKLPADRFVAEPVDILDGRPQWTERELMTH